MVPVLVDIPEVARAEVTFVWSLLCQHFGWSWERQEAGGAAAEIHIGVESGNLPVSRAFIEMLEAGRYDHSTVFRDEPLFRLTSGEVDHLGTAFYMVNSLQEYGSRDLDEYGRFRYEASYQHRFKNIDHDLVSQHFESLREQVPELRAREVRYPAKAVFLSHDIDRIKFGVLSEGNYAVRTRNLRRAATVAWKAARGRSEWANAAEVVQLHRRTGATSTFLWLPRSGTSANGIVNADYELADSQVVAELDVVRRAGFGLGLHKSAYETTLDDELALLPFPCSINRNHYLCMSLPEHYDQVQASQVRVDSTLGFSERMGYRNSYSRPFRPFSLKRRRAYDFLEVPLNMMDKSIFDSMRLHGQEAEKAALEFLQAAPAGSVTAILWHNNTLTKHRYAERLEVYEKLLECIRASALPTLSPSDFDEMLDESLSSSS